MTVERGQGGQMGGEAERASGEQAGKAELGSWGEEGVTSWGEGGRGERGALPCPPASCTGTAASWYTGRALGRDYLQGVVVACNAFVV